ncbi:MAG: ZIP family metal transporter [Solirubrobacterales bacterium]
MLEAALWGLAGASSLLIGAAIGIRAKISEPAIGLILAFGAGTLISAVAFELTEEAYRTGGADVVALGLAAGALAYLGWWWWFYRSHPDYNVFGEASVSPSLDTLGDNLGRLDRFFALFSPELGHYWPTALVLGAVLDGIPESAVIGLSLLGGGGVGVPVLAAVFISNLPESLSSSRGMRDQGVGTRRILSIWALVCLVSALAAGAGFALLDGASGNATGLLQAFAGGAVLTMLADTMIPEAYNQQPATSRPRRSAIGLLTVLGFALAYLLSTLE